MLEITRKVGEKIMLGRETVEMTVVELHSHVAKVRFDWKREKDILVFDLNVQEQPYDIVVDGERVAIHCHNVSRGEVRFGFDAPRKCKIQRTERETPA